MIRIAGWGQADGDEGAVGVLGVEQVFGVGEAAQTVAIGDGGGDAQTADLGRSASRRWRGLGAGGGI